MRLSLRLTFLLPLACPAPQASAAGEFQLSGRAGLESFPGIGSPFSELLAMSRSGFICGATTGTGVEIPWAVNPADGVSRRIGPLTGPGSGPQDFTEILRVTERGWIVGSSSGDARPVYWVADGATGVTHTLLSWPLEKMTESGFAWTRSYPGYGQAVWVMDFRTGLVTRGGFFDAAHTGVDGLQVSEPLALTESGWFGGISSRYHNGGAAVAWVTNAVTGVTRGVGWPGMGSVYIQRITEGGRVAGTSWRKPGEDTGRETSVAWVADAAGGATLRVGLHEGAEFTDAEGRQSAGVTVVASSGWIAGTSQLFKRTGFDPRAGNAAWVSDDRGGAARRVGFFQGREFVHDYDGPESGVWWLTENGWAVGSSRRFLVDPDGRSFQGGRTVWAADASTGATRRLGFTGGDFRGRAGHEESTFLGFTESGWVTGWSGSYRDANGEKTYGPAKRVPWVTRASGGETWPVGLTGPEAAGSYNEIKGLTEAGMVCGHNTRSEYPDGGVWSAAWMADAATGVVTRIGLTGENFTRGDGRQVSKILKWTKSGYIFGHSIGYSGGGDTAGGEIPWVADIRTGRTLRLGIVDGDSLTGEPHYYTEDGLVAGGSWFLTRPGYYGRGWVMDVKTGNLTVFALGRGASDGLTNTNVTGITAGGVVYGLYALQPGEVLTETRPFLWVEGLGTFVSRATAPEAADGYGSLKDIRVSDTGLAAASGWAAGGRARGVWFGPVPAAVSPDPGVRVTDLAKTAEGKFRLSFSAEKAIRMVLQFSADLTIWTDAQTIDAPAGASHMDLDPAPAAGPNRYWRLKTAPAFP